jgi:RNA polymerase sigma-70 factor (ECF subfamily)
MPFELRSVFVLFELEEVTETEIARALDLPRGTVASRLRRARKFFQDAIRRRHARDGLKGGAA